MRINKPEILGKVLIVDDEEIVRKALTKVIKKINAIPVNAKDGKEALRALKRNSFDLILLDIRLPDIDGISLLKEIKKRYPYIDIIMITGYPSIESTVECIKLGALDYLVKPFTLNKIEATLLKVLSESEIFYKDEECLPIDSSRVIIGKSPPMKKLFRKIFKVAATDSTVLITGESGTGKELVARAIHAYSNRKEKEFVAVDCSALVETLLESELFGHVKGSFTGAYQTKHGLLELANHGTFFFDEISNLSPNIQAKLLRVIQEREFMKIGDYKKIKVDIRIISASNKDISKAVEKGEFREDLYYRLSVVPINLPPLRERIEDIPLLVDHFLKKISKKIKREPPEVSKETMEILKHYPWPGNVRELEHVIERILILEDTDIIKPEHLPSFIIQQDDEIKDFVKLPLSLEEMEKRYIKFVLKYTKGKKTEAARILGINRKTLSMKIKKYGIQI